MRKWNMLKKIVASYPSTKKGYEAYGEVGFLLIWVRFPLLWFCGFACLFVCLFFSISTVLPVVLISWLYFQYILYALFQSLAVHLSSINFSTVITSDWEDTSITSYVLKDNFSASGVYLRDRGISKDINIVWAKR